jgi:hypothetical protein
MVDRVMTQALWWSINLRFNKIDGVARGAGHELNTARMWICAGHKLKVVLWDTGVEIIVLYMTPSSPDKISNYLHYRRRHKKEMAEQYEPDTDEFYDRLNKRVKKKNGAVLDNAD